MCPAAGYAFFGGARGPRPTGRYVEPRVGDGVPTSRQRGTAALRAMHAASALSYTGAGEGYTVRRCGGGSWFLGICALGLGLGILIAAVFPVGCLMFLVAFLLIACGVACLRDRR